MVQKIVVGKLKRNKMKKLLLKKTIKQEQSNPVKREGVIIQNKPPYLCEKTGAKIIKYKKLYFNEKKKES